MKSKKRNFLFILLYLSLLILLIVSVLLEILFILLFWYYNVKMNKIKVARAHSGDIM